MPKVISVPGFIGGTNRSDVMMDSPELLLNMFVEKTEAEENRGYTSKRLRSVEGERAVLEFPFSNRVGCRGLFTASDGSIFAAFDNEVYKVTKNIDGSFRKNVITTSGTSLNGSGNVVFAETGGVDSNVVWVDGSSYMYAYSLKKSALSVYHTPLQVYKSIDGNTSVERHACPTHVVCVSGVICINDGENDTWYYTDPYVLGSGNDERDIYRLDDKNNVIYKDSSKTEVVTDKKKITQQANNGVSYLWLDRYSLPKYQTAEYMADKITAMVLSNDRIYCFGTKSIQVYSLTETSDAYDNSYSVFTSTGNNTRDNGAEIGSTVAVLGGNVFWLGSSSIGDRSVWVSNGGSPIRISSNVIERELHSLGNISDAYGFAYAYNGHQFYVLTIPSVCKTYCYDASTKEWFNRSTRDSNGKDRHWFPSFAISAYNGIMLGSYSEKFLVELDSDKNTDFMDNPIIKRRVTPVFVNDFAPFRLDSFSIEWNSGTTTQAADRDVEGNVIPEANPTAMLECSIDGGNTWSEETWANSGRVGHYGWRTEWRGCFPCWVEDGMARMYVLRLTISDAVKVVITNARMQITNSRRS